MSRIVRGAQLLDYPEPSWLVPGWVPDDSIGFMYGPPSVGKSFVGMDWALNLAADDTVLYVAAERERVLIARVRDWATAHGLEQPPHSFAILAGNPQLLQQEGWREIQEAVAEVRPRIVVFDTLAQVTIGVKENDGAEMSRVVGRLDMIRRQIADQGKAGTVLTIGHTGKDETRGMRGHSSLKGRADYEIMVTRTGETIKTTVTKLNCAPEPPPRSYRLENGILISLGETAPDISDRSARAHDWLIAQGGTGTTGDAAKALGLDPKTARTAMQQHPAIMSNGLPGKKARWILIPDPPEPRLELVG